MPAMMWEGRGEVARKPTRKLQRAENLLGGASCSFRQQTPQAGRVSCYLRKLKKSSLPVQAIFPRGGHHGSASAPRRQSADDRRDAGRTIVARGSRAGGSANQPHGGLPTAPTRAGLGPRAPGGYAGPATPPN